MKKLPASKLTEEEVIKIRSSDLTQKELVVIYGYSLATIQNVITGILWKHLPGAREPQRSKLTEEDVLAIRNSDLRVRKLAKKYGVTQETIGHILTGKTWKHLPGAREPLKDIKLTEGDMLAIYESNLTRSQLAKKYSVTQLAILGIIKKEKWKHTLDTWMGSHGK